jgi:hypothetical protein
MAEMPVGAGRNLSGLVKQIKKCVQTIKSISGFGFNFLL